MSSEETSGGFPPVQYAFFTPEGGQFVFRAENVQNLQGHLDDLLLAIDETDGPGLLSALNQIKAAGLIKDATSKSSGGNAAAPAVDSGSLPPWVLPEASKVAGRAVLASEIKTGIAKSGRNQGQPWYKFGDTWINQPR